MIKKKLLFIFLFFLTFKQVLLNDNVVSDSNLESKNSSFFEFLDYYFPQFFIYQGDDSKNETGGKLDENPSNLDEISQETKQIVLDKQFQTLQEIIKNEKKETVKVILSNYWKHSFAIFSFGACFFLALSVQLNSLNCKLRDLNEKNV